MTGYRQSGRLSVSPVHIWNELTLSYTLFSHPHSKTTRHTIDLTFTLDRLNLHTVENAHKI